MLVATRWCGVQVEGEVVVCLFDFRVCGSHFLWYCAVIWVSDNVCKCELWLRVLCCALSEVSVSESKEDEDVE